jgi:hypothetical protein
MFYFAVKCYLRKGHALVAMQEFGQAKSAFSKALEIDSSCQVKEFLSYEIYFSLI